MKLKKLHIIYFLFLLLVSAQNSTTLKAQEVNRTFDPHFKERYTGNKFNYEGTAIVTKTPSGSGNYEDYKNKKTDNPEVNNGDYYYINLGPLSWLFYIAIFAAIIYLAYILFNEGGSGLFSTKHHKKLQTHDDITADNIENSDIDSLIKHAEQSKNYRLAIRYYYLLVLKTLSLKNHIKFEDDKTNAEYLSEIRSKPFSQSFEYTSYLYNYIWYGEFPLNTDEYLMAKGNFITLLNEVK